MKLIDTSSWIESLRFDGDRAVGERVRALLLSGEAAWCPLVKVELWNGARGDHEKKVLREMEENLAELEIAPAVWAQACDLARKARSAGHTVPATDLLIAACARHHHVELEHTDTHFDMLEKLR
ncbi:MAG: PIN domain-containing protein [Kiritimatiellia bacterium]